MIDINNDGLTFSFPELDERARGRISFQRTLRLPDDNKTYPLPAGFGDFSIRHIEDFRGSFNDVMLRRGGVIMPMYESEAMWINFHGDYPMAVKIATGKINAVTGDSWENELSDSPQDYIVIPEQPWLDGYNTGDNEVRQFVATKQGGGKTAEEQLSGKADVGGIQIIVYPMKLECYKKLISPDLPSLVAQTNYMRLDPDYNLDYFMGLTPGGRIKQTIHDDPYGIEVWDTQHSSRCFVNIVDSTKWTEITEEPVPHPPITSKQYEENGVPWFEHYSQDTSDLKKSDKLSSLKSIGEFTNDESDYDVVVTKPMKVSEPTSKIVSEGEF
jgi:hypothetical protein